MSEPASDLDTDARELVARYRQETRTGSADAAAEAALRLGRALDAIQRVKRSSHSENAYQLAARDIAEAQEAMDRLVAGP